MNTQESTAFVVFLVFGGKYGKIQPKGGIYVVTSTWNYMMRHHRFFGRDKDSLPTIEPFCVRAIDLSHDLRICCRCLKNKRRCQDSRRPYRDSSWKSYRIVQYRDR